ncbi:hypothetical protein CVT26_015717 [Gymnopilus dilepis]|uniref:RING-type E3 ubiquitin transferase n=1 Tax=Gymnopilus dilepis TaxID=231916 RepID=A0A409VFH4_9AGAR|nr:hypothetical protein CVT26_015717 [Gymnopilus dilepis]
MADVLHQVARSLNSHRVLLYSLLSFVSVSAVITNALRNYSNFYSVAIFLSKSSRSVLVLANFGVLLTILFGHIVQRIFFGSLRPNEVERLYDRLWFFITESLLAFTIFRDEFDTPFALMFGFLLFVKSFHWLASDRIEWMDQRPYPGPPLLFHVRMTILFAILSMTDCLMFLFAIEHTLSTGVGGMVLFASEYGILMASVMNTILKYLLSAYDLRRAGRRGGENAPPWENKSMWVFYIELGTDFLKLTTYLVFFIIIITFYGLPLNIVRDVYITARSFITRLRALHRYQTATRNMDQRYPNATEEELSAMSDRTCIICREEMSNTVQGPPAHPDGPNTTPKKLPCGHIFHFYCLRSWLERQQSCPTCRRNVLETPTAAPQPAVGNLPAQPPAPAAPGQPANQNPPANVQNGQDGNNPLGLIGRFLGLPPRPANAVPHRHTPQNANLPQRQQGGQGPGIYINYQVQYQFPRPNENGDAQGGQQQRQPVPPYPGFPAPGGVWQPWPAEEAPRAERATTEERTAEPPSSDESPTTDSTSTLSDPQSSVTTEEKDEPSPREAAARAALSRLGSQKTSESSSKQPSDSRSTNATASSSKTTEAQSSKAAPSAGVQLPKLIPLFDYQSPGPLSRSSGPVHQFNGPLAPSLPRATSSSSTRQSTRNVPTSTSSLPSISSPLPPVLDAEQLATLDTLTRESIDERLRILESVSANVYRCIDDLMRLRSALPPLNTSSARPGPSTGETSVPTGGEAKEESKEESSAKDKGKMQEASVEDSRPEQKDNNTSHAGPSQ